MLQRQLEQLGLTPHEADLYLHLFRRGKSRAGDLIKDSGLHRNLVYQALGSLVSRRLVTKTTQQGVFHFQVTDLEHFRDPIREQELTAQQVIQALQEREKLTEQEITVYEGEDAIRTFSLKNAASLEPGEILYVLGSGGKRFQEAMGIKALRSYFEEIDRRGAGVRVLKYRLQQYTQEMYECLKKIRDGQIRILPNDLAPVANVVFTNKSVAFQIFEHPYTVIEVRNAHLVDAYKNYFQLLWTQNVRIQRGPDALRDAFYSMVDSLRTGEEYYVLGGNLGSEYARLSHFFDDYHRYRIQKGVVAKILAQRDAAKGIRARNQEQGDLQERVSHVKSFQTPFLSPMQINLYRGQAVMVIYQPEPMVLYFEDPAIYSGFKLYFDEIWDRRVETLFGHQGIIDLCELILEKGEDLYLIAATGTIMKTHAEYYPDFTRRRSEKKIHMHILANENTRGTKMGSLPHKTIRYLPPAFASPMVIWIFGDTVAHVLWHEPETVFLIHDASIATYYRQYFDGLKRVSRE